MACEFDNIKRRINLLADMDLKTGTVNERLEKMSRIAHEYYTLLEECNNQRIEKYTLSPEKSEQDENVTIGDHVIFTDKKNRENEGKVIDFNVIGPGNFNLIVKEERSGKELSIEPEDVINVKKKDDEAYNFRHLVGSKFGSFCYNFKTFPVENIPERRSLIFDILETESEGKSFAEYFDQIWIQDVFLLYDQYFFDNYLLKFTSDNNCGFSLCFDNEQCYEIVQSGNKKSVRMYFNTAIFEWILLQQNVSDEDLITALLIAFEHEMIHSLISCYCTNNSDSGEHEDTVSIDGAHSNTFKSMARNIFGHSEIMVDSLSQYIAKMLGYDDSIPLIRCSCSRCGDYI